MRAMTSRARSPSAAMLSRVARADTISGGSAASQRAPAPALAIIPASGWLTSWAIEVVSSPSVVSRDTCASSICALASASCARLSSVMSAAMPLAKGFPRAARINVQRLWIQRVSPSGRTMGK